MVTLKTAPRALSRRLRGTRRALRRPQAPRCPGRRPCRAPHLDTDLRMAPSRPPPRARRRPRPRRPHLDPARRLRHGTHFLVPVKAVAKRSRGRFLGLARRALPGVDFPDIPWSKKWVVFAKPTVQGADAVLAYLGRYVHKTAITDRALVGLHEDTVSFRYRDSRDQRRRTMTLPAQEFLRRFPQHVLPKGLHRARRAVNGTVRAARGRHRRFSSMEQRVGPPNDSTWRTVRVVVKGCSERIARTGNVC